MGLGPENGRLFVGGIPAGAGDADLRRHFRRYGAVADVCLPRDRLTGRPRRFAFVQFARPSDAGRALADQQHHAIDGRRVRIARAEPPASHGRAVPQHQRTCRVGGRWRYRVGDVLRISFGPLGEEGAESVKGFGFGSIVDGVSIFDCTIGHVSEDGKRCLIRWPPEKQSDGYKLI